MHSCTHQILSGEYHGWHPCKCTTWSLGVVYFDAVRAHITI